MPTVIPAPAVEEGRLYALCSSEGPNPPEGPKAGETAPAAGFTMSVLVRTKH